jgi:hypothetical protein
MAKIKTVFVVLGYVDYEGHELLAIFSTRKKAEAYMVEFDKVDHYYDDVAITEYPLDFIPLGPGSCF